MIFLTEDGSHSILSEQFGVNYHSKHGAIQETQHVFIDAALRFKAKEQKTLSVLDIGLGTGLNAFMTYLEASKMGLQIAYTGIEAFPISLEQAHTLNYASVLNIPQEQAIFLQLHECPWDTINIFNDHFSFTKKQIDFLALDFDETFDVIYFDAFSPSSQAELWEAPLLSKMYQALQPKGVLTTYCAKGAVKRCLKSVGFSIEGIPGPPGKREMTRALKG